MTEPRDPSRQVGQWIEKADHDLRNAEHTVTIADDSPTIPHNEKVLPRRSKTQMGREWFLA